MRPFNCVGIGERRAVRDTEIMSGNVKLAMTHVVPDLVQKVLKGQDPLHILGDGNQVRHYTYGGDLARGIRLAIESPKAVNEDFNLSTAASTTVLELAELIWRKIHGPDKPFRYVSDEPFEHDVQLRVPDVRKARDVLGFEATTTLDDDARRGDPVDPSRTRGRAAVTRRASQTCTTLASTSGRSAPRMVYGARLSAMSERWVDPAQPVLDIACDRGHFIHWVSADTSAGRPTSATFRAGSAARRPVRLRHRSRSGQGQVPTGYFGTVFMSNYLEHLESSDTVIEQLRGRSSSCLRPGGRLIVLQPNIRLVGPRYWDFIDHRVALPERSLLEAAELANLRTVGADHPLPAVLHEGALADCAGVRQGVSRTSNRHGGSWVVRRCMLGRPHDRRSRDQHARTRRSSCPCTTRAWR